MPMIESWLDAGSQGYCCKGGLKGPESALGQGPSGPQAKKGDGL